MKKDMGAPFIGDMVAVFPLHDSSDGALLPLPADPHRRHHLRLLHRKKMEEEDAEILERFRRDVAQALGMDDPVLITANDNEIDSLHDLYAAAGHLVYAQARSDRLSIKPIPGPPTKLIIGNTDMFMENPHEAYLGLHRKYGDIVEIFFFNIRFVVVADAKFLSLILNETSFFTKQVTDTAFEELAEIGGVGLFTTDTTDPDWKLGHKLLLPAFSLKSLQQYVPHMNKIAMQTINVFRQIGVGGLIDVKEWATRMTFQTIGKIGFDFDFHMIDSPDSPVHPFIRAMNDSLFEVQKRIFRTKHWKKLPIPANHRFRKSIQLMHKTVDDVIEQRRKSRGSDDAPQDVLDYMLQATDPDTGEGMQMALIRDEIITLLIAGHETVANLLSWTLYLLSQHPEIEKRAVREAFAVLGSDLDRMPTFQDLNRMTYLTQIIKESLRLYPTNPRVEKLCVRSCRLGPYPVRKGDVAELNVMALHRNTKYWGPNPDVFDPDHFTPKAEAARHPYAWVPFGVGARACIGKQFAFLEAKVFLTLCLRHYSFGLPSGAKVEINPQAPSLVPTNLKMTLHPRDPAAAGVDPALAPAAAADGAAAGAATLPRPPAPLLRSGTANPDVMQSFAQLPVNLPRPTIQVVFGSNMGQSEDYANQLTAMARRLGFEAPSPAPLDTWAVLKTAEGDIADAVANTLLLVVTSTYNGTPPDNALVFDKWISRKRPAKLLENLKFAVFGAGNAQWRTFQAFPRKIDTRLAAMGAERVFDRGEGNADVDIDQDFSDWSARFWTYVRHHFQSTAQAIPNPKEASKRSDSLSSQQAPPQHVRILPTTDVDARQRALENNEAAPREAWKKPPQDLDYYRCPIVENRSVKRSGAVGAETHYLALRLPEGRTYTTGDHLEVCPENRPDLVDAYCKRLGWDPETPVELQGIDDMDAADGRRAIMYMPSPVLLRTALARFCDITSPVSKLVIQALAPFAGSDAERIVLESLTSDSSSGARHYATFVVERRRSLLDLLVEFQSVQAVPIEKLLPAFSRLPPRRYSIASSVLEAPDQVQLTVAIATATNMQGEQIEGVASGYLCHAPVGTEVLCAVKPVQHGFHPPADPATPIILIGPGTGLAPFLGFLQDRRATLKKAGKIGPVVLYHGAKVEADVLYPDELHKMKDDGVISTLRIAVSRANPNRRVYVQHLVAEDGDLLWSLIDEGKAVVYICGNARNMAPAVFDAFVGVVKDHGHRDDEAARQYLAAMRATDRYVEEVWG